MNDYMNLVTVSELIIPNSIRIINDLTTLVSDIHFENQYSKSSASSHL